MNVSDALDIRLGATGVTAVYVGANKVWPLGGGSTFDPLTLSPALWLDASDASTISLDGSSKVSQWSDKSGNARHFTDNSAPSERPTYADTRNGLSVVSFNGAQFLGAPVFSASTSAFTLIAVLAEGATGSRRVSVSMGSNSHIAISGWNNNAHVGGLLGSVAWMDSSLPGTSDWMNLTFMRESGTNRIRVDGSDVGGGGTSTPIAATGQMELGRDAGTFVVVQLAEIIAIDRALTSDELADIDAYLRAKWDTP